MDEITLWQRLGLTTIHNSMTDEFIDTVFKVYEKNSVNRVFKLPHTIITENGAFFELYEKSYGILLESFMRNHFPENRWGTFTEDEFLDYEDRYKEIPWGAEEPMFLRDVCLVLDLFQLFYIRVRSEYDPLENKYGDVIEEIHNSPLQEVW